jgi:hypothetical protein
LGIVDPVTAEPYQVLAPLFQHTREADEFEFCCTLMRIRGAEDTGWDPLRESDTLAHQISGLIQAPLDHGLRLRLLLFLYCHLTEMEDLYKVIANLLRVIQGERYNLNPFATLPKLKRKQPNGYRLSERIDQLIALSQQAGFSDVGELFAAFYVRPVRNAFYHSDYILTQESFNIRWGEGVNVDNVIDRRVRLDWLVPRLELGVNTALAMFAHVSEHARSYTEDKIVRGRFGPNDSYVDIQLTTHSEYGLRGFKSPPDPGRDVDTGRSE